MRILLISFALTFCISCQPKDLPTTVVNTDNIFEARFSHMTTKAEIEQVAKMVEEKGGEINYSKSTFFEDGKLRDLSISVRAPNGNAGATSALLTALQYSYYGFQWDKEGQFGIGAIKN